MSTQSKDQLSRNKPSKRRMSNSRMARLEDRVTHLEDKVAEFEFLAVCVDGDITFPADWRERQSRDH